MRTQNQTRTKKTNKNKEKHGNVFTYPHTPRAFPCPTLCRAASAALGQMATSEQRRVQPAAGPPRGEAEAAQVASGQVC